MIQNISPFSIKYIVLLVHLYLGIEPEIEIGPYSHYCQSWFGP